MSRQLKTPEAALQSLFALPDFESDSEQDGDSELDDDEIATPTAVQRNNIVDDDEDDEIATPSAFQRNNIVDDDEENCSPRNSESVRQRSPSPDDMNRFDDEPTEWGNEVTDHFKNLTLNLDKHPRYCDGVSSREREIVYFEQLIDANVLQNIVTQTNLYASQERTVTRNGVPVVVRTLNWVDLTVNELRAFIGCLIIMGIHVLPSVDNYWSSDSILGVPEISQVMTLKRYKKIIEVIHLNDNCSAVPKGQDGYNKLHKVEPLSSALKVNLTKKYKSSSHVAVDESMIPFKGRSSLKQYNPMKTIKRGYKVWCLADSESGYILNFDIYTGKSATTVDGTLGERVVVNLSTVLKDEQFLLAFDNFFTSYKLMTGLLSKGIHACGTVRANRRGLPEMLKTNDKLQRGHHLYSVRGSVAATKWQDNKPVSMLSTAHDPTKTSLVNRKNKDGSRTSLPCPQVVDVYNNIMGGVDRFDQLRERYAIGRRSVKWWHRIFHYLLDVGIVCSFIAWKVNTRTASVGTGKRDQLSFRLKLARQLIGNYTSRKRTGRPISFRAPKRGVPGVPDEVRTLDVGKHLPVKETTWKRCRQCSTKNKEKRTRIMCSACTVPLCIDPCFSQFHDKV